MFERYLSFTTNSLVHRRSQWPCGLRRWSAAARLLGLWVRFPQGSWMDVCCECCVLPGRVLLRRADHSSRGVLPIVVRCCVWSRSLVNEEAMTHWGGCRAKNQILVHRNLAVCCGTGLRNWCNGKQTFCKWIKMKGLVHSEVAVIRCPISNYLFCVSFSNFL